MTATTPPRPVVLTILDGWGHRESCENNAICQGATPVLDRLTAASPHALIDASEHEVGLPTGQMGNSEVGHMNLGAGRIVLQDLPRIDEAIATGALAENDALHSFVEAVKAGSGRVHLLGLLSPGGVHSHQIHMAALANLLLDQGLDVLVHGFLDGRDTPPRSALGYLEAFQGASRARVATLCGRFYTMDRDKRWERVSLAYDALMNGQGGAAETAEAAVETSYAAGVSDEFLLPCSIGGYQGMAEGDGLFMANFRADRARQLLGALLDPDFDGFERSGAAKFSAALGMVSYSSDLDRFLATLFPPLDLAETLGEVVAAAGLKQLRIAETEKYAHVTFFFNGGREDQFSGESRILVPSPKVATYDLQPEMSAPEVTERMVEAIHSGNLDLIIANFANGDMVGHTGNLAAATQAVEAVDQAIGRLEVAVREQGGCLLITADHGNAEQMADPKTGQSHTAHTMNRVPIILANGPAWVSGLKDGRLADIAPTILELLRLPKPAVMTGRSLLDGQRAVGSEAAE